jgi:2-C-methyl-D-erythritol 4-phosphate cytidylyltransferase
MTASDETTMTAPDVGVVIVAAGSGSRAAGTSGELKQFRWVGDKPMLLHAVHAFQKRRDVALVVCVLPRSHAADPPPWLFQSDLPDDVSIAVIHDAARPLVTDATIDAVITEARKGHGAIAALPVVDTLKEVDASGRITRTIARDGLWRAQTPQAFPIRLIERAYMHAQRDGVIATDDAALVERLGEEVIVVRGSERAMKVTEESDFARVERLSTLPD